MKNYLNLAEASKLTQLSERSLRRIAKQLLSEQSSDVRIIKTKTGFRYELSLSYLRVHYHDQLVHLDDQLVHLDDQPVHLEKPLNDQLVHLDDQLVHLEKPLNDQLVHLDDQLVHLEKPLNDQLVHLDDQPVHLEKPLDDQLVHLDDQPVHLEKPLNDQLVHLDDHLEYDRIKSERDKLFQAHMELLHHISSQQQDITGLQNMLNNERERYNELSTRHSLLQAQTNQLHAQQNEQVKLLTQRLSTPADVPHRSDNVLGFWVLVVLLCAFALLLYLLFLS